MVIVRRGFASRPACGVHPYATARTIQRVWGGFCKCGRRYL